MHRHHHTSSSLPEYGRCFVMYWLHGIRSWTCITKSCSLFLAWICKIQIASSIAVASYLWSLIWNLLPYHFQDSRHVIALWCAWKRSPRRSAGTINQSMLLSESGMKLLKRLAHLQICSPTRTFRTDVMEWYLWFFQLISFKMQWLF